MSPSSKPWKSRLSKSEEYLSFRSSVPLKKVVVDDEGDKVWKIFDCGPREVTCPLMCLPPVSGTADVFFLQAMALSAKGYRVISVEAPAYWNMEEWVNGFKKLLDHLHLEKVHLFGSALGGFLAQKFAEYARPCPRVASLILCNTFTDTSAFHYEEQSQMFWLLPSPVLKGLIQRGLCSTSSDPSIQGAADFMEERLQTLDQSSLASRLKLNCTPCYVSPQYVNDLPTTIIDVWDESALCQAVKDDMYKSYPNAKLGHLKTGGNFPFLCRSDEVNLLIMIHLRNFGNAI